MATWEVSWPNSWGIASGLNSAGSSHGQALCCVLGQDTSHSVFLNLRGSITRGLLIFCVNCARIIKVHSLINKITFK